MTHGVIGSRDLKRLLHLTPEFVAGSLRASAASDSTVSLGRPLLWLISLMRNRSGQLPRSPECSENLKWE